MSVEVMKLIDRLLAVGVMTGEQAEVARKEVADMNGDEEVCLSLKRKEVKITLEHEDGLRKKYILRELAGPGRSDYMNRMSKRVKIVDGRPAGLTSFDGLESSLIAMCLFDEKGVAVPEREISGWPSSTQQALFSRAQKMSALGASSEQEAKNA